MCILNDVNELKLVPEVETSFLAASHKVTIQLPDADVPSAWLWVEVVVDQGTSSDLPVAEMQVTTGHELSSSFYADRRQVSHRAQWGKCQSHAS